MPITKRYIQNLNDIKNDIPRIAKDIIEENSEDIINVLKFAQLGIGLNSDGVPLAWARGDGFYAKSTQEIANSDPSYSNLTTKTFGDAYNFQWTGLTFAFMDIKFLSSDKFEIFTTSGKQGLLENIYGEIFKLTEQHNKWVNEMIILPGLQEYILRNMFDI